MCTVAAVAMLIVSAASTAASVDAQNKQTKAQEQSAKTAAQADYQALELQGVQISSKAAQEGVEIQREAMIQRGRIIAAQSEAGFLGNSPIRELAALRLKEKEALAANEANRGMSLAQNRTEAEAIRARAQGRMNEATSRRINSVAAGLQIGSSAIQGYSIGKGIK